MPLAVLPYPEIDPILLQIGPVAIRWYALSYIAGIILGWRWLLRINRTTEPMMDPERIDDFMVWLTLAIVIGGRLGYVLFYNFSYYMTAPVEIVMPWLGGMSFHGGLLGVAVAIVLFSRRHGLSPLGLADLVAAVVPLGLFFGRLANFINGELFGRASTVAWSMVFPMGGPQSRHPSQLYEAALEGALLFVILTLLIYRAAALRRPGLISGVFLVGYSLTRGFVELFREPDAHIGFIAGGMTMGQLLSLPMMIIGAWLMWRAWRRAPLR